MPRGIQTYNLELHYVEPIDWSDIDLDDDIEIGESNDNIGESNNEIILVGYKDYTLEVHRNTYHSSLNNKTYIQSRVEILKGELKLKDTYRFEPDEYHPDGMILTELPLMVATTKNPIAAEYKLIDKAQLIIDRLNEDGSAVLVMCNNGNILEMAE